ncbi:phosphoenolpyruvate--protein phosphotransferase [Lampropedia puyangensis]|uniref:Phosphoenolpyruvate-protein phosphotransferase n=1 Tax=Lampropedia puyangensis TaxID=1330072 RepID=A0A4S8F093_9BURK|nr:phosphoenolpyruvate--protein phosphotransferase [Lampropedia puyangensis]THU00668.1 phosphoenolpyruvate--protein phosphotransferase [Lampropedia puyangensis]
MNERINGIAVSRGIAIGRALLLGREPLQVKHYLVSAKHIEREIKRLDAGFAQAIVELRRVQKTIANDASSAELHALLDVHAMLLEDPELRNGATAFIQQRRYNAEWALMQQLAHFSREFDAMDDSYLRERKVDLEQLVSRVVHCMRAATAPAASVGSATPAGDALEQALIDLSGHEGQDAEHFKSASQDVPLRVGAHHTMDWPCIIVAHDLAPADMLHFKHDAFAGFIADTGGATSHTAIVARSLDIPAVVGTTDASKRISQDAIVIVQADAGLVIINPDEATLAHYSQLQKEDLRIRERQEQLRHTAATTQDGKSIELLANIEFPADCQAAMAAGAVGVGLFRSEFLFMGRHGALPDEQEQYQAYREAVEAMHGLPVTIRTVDIGADKLLDAATQGRSVHDQSALGLRAIRWSLSSLDMFRTQLRALLRAAAHGPLNILLPMISHAAQVQQARVQLELARQELQKEGLPFGLVQLGAMVEVPAAALMIELLLDDLDFVSIGSNDLTQYTLAVDRANEAVAHLFDATHPAVLRLIAHVIAQCQQRGKHVSVCGEIAGDPQVTDLLLGLGLESFSMHPVQLLAVKERILHANTQTLSHWSRSVLASADPQALISQHALEVQQAA